MYRNCLTNLNARTFLFFDDVRLKLAFNAYCNKISMDKKLEYCAILINCDCGCDCKSLTQKKAVTGEQYLINSKYFNVLVKSG